VSSAPFDVEAVRREFPILSQSVHGRPLVYLDSAASAQKPRAVIDAECHVYERIYANVHRGVHRLSGLATDAYEAVRGKVRAHLGGQDNREVVFVRGTTEAINLVAQSWGRTHVGPGDEVLVTGLEHHSNIVPWQMLVAEKGAKLVVAPIDDTGTVDLERFEKALSPRTRLVAIAHVSNALGTVNPVATMATLAHAHGAVVLVDGAQAIPHERIDVSAIGCDFYAFSAHKAYGPSGAGVLWGRKEILDAMPPWQGGGDMILSCSFAGTTYNDVPYKLEAGTPNIAGVIAMGTAIDWMNRVGIEAIAAHEEDLLAHGTLILSEVPGLHLIGTAREKVGVLSFVLDGVHPHDVGTILDYEGIAVRTGHHCAQPVMEHFGIPATTRASLACYNTRSDLDALVAGLHKVCNTFR